MSTSPTPEQYKRAHVMDCTCGSPDVPHMHERPWPTRAPFGLRYIQHHWAKWLWFYDYQRSMYGARKMKRTGACRRDSRLQPVWRSLRLPSVTVGCDEDGYGRVSFRGNPWWDAE